MTNRRYLEEWPLAAFTLAIQVACGIAIATTIASVSRLPVQTAPLRALGISVFPIVCAGLLLSLMHLGRPLSAWRAVSNLHSRLSLEVLLTVAFALSAFAYSFTWWTGVTALRVYSGMAASVIGVSAVLASAAIYKVAARPAWNSGWVMTSFIGSTVTVGGLVLLTCSRTSPLGTTAIVAGSALLLFSGLWMWMNSSQCLGDAKRFRPWFIGYLLLAIPAPLLVIFGANFLPGGSVALAFCTMAVAVITGRMLMFAIAELEPRF